MSSFPSRAIFYPLRFVNNVYYYFSGGLLWHPDSLDLSQYVVLEGIHYIAIGEHADLWLGKMTNKKPPLKVAVKVLRGGSSSNPDFLIKFKERLEREAHIWQHLKHPNVSEFYGLAFNFGYMPALILPFYGNGTVVEYLKERSNEARLAMVRQIAQGLEYLHGQSVIHGDLRGSNVLIDGDGNPRICDYGLAFIIEPSEFTSIKTAGACRWTAPEIMNPPEDTTSTNDALALFTKESDVYAFAMTVIEIFTGKIPFSQKKNDSSVIFAVLDGGRPELPPFLQEQESLRQLVQNCWDQAPSRRPTSRAVNMRLSPDKSETTSDVGSPSNGWIGSWF
jgi:serine/threonine protein kinase